MNKKYIEPNLVKIAAEQDVFDILTRGGVPMKRTGGVYRHREHDSLVISKGEGFYWFSQGYGSKNPIDYYVKVENMPFVQAAYKVLEVMNYDYSRKDVVLADNISVNPNYIQGSFELPEKADTNKNAYAYLVKTRGLDGGLIASLIDNGLIYQDRKFNNAVFIGKDFDGNIVSAFKRSTKTNVSASTWTKGDASGSHKEYRFRIENPTNKTVNIFESEIDLLSYISMQPEIARNENYISLGGVSERAAICFLEHNEHIEHLNICTDNDEAGHKFCTRLSEQLGKDYYITREISRGKDFNEDLLNGYKGERNRIDVMVFDASTKEMTKREKIKYINELFSSKYQGMKIELPIGTNDLVNTEAYINQITRKGYRIRDNIENAKAYSNRLNLGVEKDIANLIETSAYVKTKEEVKAEQNSIHKATAKWHYFNKPLVIDNNIFNFIVDVRENHKKEAYIYKIRLKEIDFEEIHESGESSQTPRQGVLTRERPPLNIYNINSNPVQSQGKEEKKAGTEEKKTFSFSKDEDFEF
ncbi:MAG: DUF3991 and toprim domain-containing protein [Eubacterium sp.]|nr:DUF3991 and toprim domain-containing protein [Eubacterium sp.]